MGKKLIIIILIVIISLALASFLRQKPLPRVPVKTNQEKYELGEFPVITIKNTLNNNICFSECYRYYLEKKNETWESYIYGECQELDVIKRCIKPEEAIGLELILEGARPGLHRVAVPVCFNCQMGEEFKEDQKLYSNQFIIQ